MARGIISSVEQLKEWRVEMEVYWVAGNMDVERNEKVDEATKKEAEMKGTCRCPKQFTSLSHIG